MLQITGVLDHGSGARLKQDVDTLVASGVTTVWLDCTKLELIDSTGLSSLFQCQTTLQQVGGQLLLSDLSESMHGLLMHTGLDALLTVL